MEILELELESNRRINTDTQRLGTTHRPHRRRSRRRRLFPRISLHGGLLPAQDPRLARPRSRRQCAVCRRDGRPIAQACACLYARRDAASPGIEIPRVVEDPLCEFDGEGRDRVRQIRVCEYAEGRPDHQSTRGEFLGYEITCA
jgi:hypothetical protein